VTKVFIDTSVFIRFLTQDNQQKFEQCAKFFELIEQGKLRPYTSNIVILEIQFVLTRLYSFPKDKVLSDINKLLSLRNLILVERTDSHKALTIYKKYNVKYPDCLIVTQIPAGSKLVSYDNDFVKISTLALSTPADFS